MRRKDKNGATHLFVEEYADREDIWISWTEFLRLWRRTTSSRPPGVRSTREPEHRETAPPGQRMRGAGGGCMGK
ncbi:hypothetical protein [Sorangium sp. So ce128]|uniref:hypothetical protein n=1 Tax=Sorangium sp. So ce128 TaxID=3133281 RepID=UPI003F639E1D